MNISTMRALAFCLVASVLAIGCDSSDPSTPTGPVATLEASGGELADAASFTVTSASVSTDGWLAVWHEFSSSKTLAGKVFLTAGAHTNIVVPLDPPVGALAATQGYKLRLSVHADAPADGAFTATDTLLDGPDPVMLNAAGKPVVGVLDVTLPPSDPNDIIALDQTLNKTPPSVALQAAIDAIPTFIVIKNAAGTVLGSERAFDRNYRNYNIRIDLPLSWTPAPLTAGLFANKDDAPDLDSPVLSLDGAPVVRTFNVTYPPENILSVGDQTLLSWGYKIKIGEVNLDELPAIVVVHADASGAPGEVLGSIVVDTSPKISVNVNLRRFVEPTEVLWVVVYKDNAPVGAYTDTDTKLLGTDAGPLQTMITVTNASCDGLKTKYCDPATPHDIRWLDRCDTISDVVTPCGDDALCDDTGPYVACKDIPDPCAGIGGKVCVDEDPTATWFEDMCGNPLRVASRCGATSLCTEDADSATCRLAPSCGGNTSKVCDPNDLTKVFWLDRCGERNGNSFNCGSTSTCDDSDGEAGCTMTPSCAGNTSLVCNPADLDNLYWLNNCGVYSGSTTPCGTGFQCDVSGGSAKCVNPNPCVGPSTKFCDPDDLSVIKWVNVCGEVLNSTIPCGTGYACQETSGTPVCVSTDVCGGNTSKVCVEDDPGHVYWVDGCGELTGSTYPCGVSTCDDTGGEAICTYIGSCEDTKTRVCDPMDDTVVRLKNACGTDLGVFSTCANGKQCTEETVGDARCNCVPTENTRCFGGDFLYEPSGIRKIDSCGNWTNDVVETCANGEVCAYEGQTPVCTTSLTNEDSPMYHRGCSFVDYVTYKTDLDVECRCRRHAARAGDIDRYDMGGNLACRPQADSFAEGWTMGDGPQFRHMLISFNGGGVYSAATNEIFATKSFVDPNYQGAGMVVGYNITTGARRIVSGRFPETDGNYAMYGSGFESVRAVGTLRHEATTLPGAWDLEMGADGKLYVWGSRDGNKEITRVDPTTGARTLVWKQALEGATAAPAHGQCYSTRPGPTYFGGFIPVQLESHAFTMGADGSFYLGFRNNGAEGNGIMKISADGSTCTVISRWNGDMGNIGAGATPQYSNLEGFFIRAGKLYATLQIGKVLLSIDIANGNRTVIANPPGSVESTTGQSTMFWDATRNLLITAGGVQSYLAVGVDVATGRRQALFLAERGSFFESAPPWETGAHGAIDNGNYMGYGALVMDPSDNDHIYLVIKWGLLKYEISTGNSYVMSQ